MVMHSFNPSPWEEKAADLWELEATLVCRIAKAIQRNCLKNQNKTKDAPGKYYSSLLKMFSFHNLRPTASNVGFLFFRK